MITPVSFVGGASGPWHVLRVQPVIGPGLPAVARLRMVEGPVLDEPVGEWTLQGVVSNLRYATAAEAQALRAGGLDLGRPEADRAALIPIVKSAEWWRMAQDERRAVIEEKSGHISLGLKHVPAVARRLHHGREIGAEFDFLTWFEYPASASADFEELVAQLRASAEWDWVEREVDVRLAR
ncbi:MAG: chlorite dismutase family protein [Sporichthyaceae bacterium]